jgi:light-regulated signal transduction histidine kinase (bacteriophytochrome)
LIEDYQAQLDPEGLRCLENVRLSTRRMGQIIEGLLKLSRAARSIIQRDRVDLSALAEEILDCLQGAEADRQAEWTIQAGLQTYGDANLLRIALENLFGNAWKYTTRRPTARIEFGAAPCAEGSCFYVRDNGVGFDMKYAAQIFTAFERLHPSDEFDGNGIGLATVERIIRRHGGAVWAEGVKGQGATFYFTLPETNSPGGINV